MMDIGELNAILSVFQFRNYSDAAANLAVSQSTLSKQISHVESELGIQIFERAKKGKPAELTVEGQAVIKYIQNTVNSYQDTIRISRELSVNSEQEICVGYVPSIGTFGDPKALVQFITRYPDVRIHLTPGSNERLIEYLYTRTLDAIILTVPEWDLAKGATFTERFYRPELETIEMACVDKLYLSLNNKNPLALCPAVNKDVLDAQKDQIVVLNPKSAYIGYLERACKTIGIGLPQNMRYLDFDRLGVIYTLLDRNTNYVVPFVGTNIRSHDNRVVVPVEGWNVKTYQYLMCLKSDKRKVLRQFKNVINEYFENNPAT